MANVLLLDDDETLRSLLAETLQAEGHHVRQGDNGFAAFNPANISGIDLMITDLYMPRVDGLEAILNVRRDIPDLLIIAMSGGGDYVKTDFLTQTKLLGVTAVLHKPFHLKAFQDTVRAVLAMSVDPISKGRRRALAS